MGAAVAEATIERRVEAGATWLDERKPGWWRDIDTDALDMADPCRCVLAYTDGDYYQAPITNEQAYTLGFDAADDGEEFDALRAAWIVAIERRRAEAGAAP